MNNSKLSDDMLRESAHRVRSLMLAALPEPEDCYHRFSKGFERKIRKLIGAHNKKARSVRSIRNIAAIIVIVFILSFTWLVTDANAYAELGKWLREVLQNSIVYRFFETNTQTNIDQYMFGWLPEGYREVSEEKGSDFGMIMASDESNHLFILEYQFTGDNTLFSLVGESGISETIVTIHGTSAYLYVDETEGAPSELVWIEDNIVFKLNSNADRQSIQFVAEGVKRK